VSTIERNTTLEQEKLNKKIRDSRRVGNAQVFYSDKSESSVEELMEDTPSNYNIPNGRLDGKSQGFMFGRKSQLQGGSPKKPLHGKTSSQQDFPGV